jgi:hypothetical protein
MTPCRLTGDLNVVGIDANTGSMMIKEMSGQCKRMNIQLERL